MKKIYLFPITFFCIGIGCFITYNIIGSYIAPDGTLVEPFALIPIGYIMIAISVITGIILYIRESLK